MDKIPGWVYGVLVAAFLVGQVLHWMTLAKVDNRLAELMGDNGNGNGQ